MPLGECVHVCICRQFICVNATDKHGGVAVTRVNTFQFLWLSHVSVVIWFVPNCTPTICQLWLICFLKKLPSFKKEDNHISLNKSYCCLIMKLQKLKFFRQFCDSSIDMYKKFKWYRRVQLNSFSTGWMMRYLGQV